MRTSNTTGSGKGSAKVTLNKSILMKNNNNSNAGYTAVNPKNIFWIFNY